MDEQTARQISALINHDAWKALKRELERVEEAYVLQMGRRIRRGEVIPAHEISYMKGRFDGAQMLLCQPDRAVLKLSKLEESESLV